MGADFLCKGKFTGYGRNFIKVIFFRNYFCDKIA